MRWAQHQCADWELRLRQLYCGVCNHFTASDIVALKLLSVELPAPIALDLLEGALGEEATSLLQQIPTSVNLWDVEACELIEKGSPADSLWQLLEKQDGAGYQQLRRAGRPYLACQATKVRLQCTDRPGRRCGYSPDIVGLARLSGQAGRFSAQHLSLPFNLRVRVVP